MLTKNRHHEPEIDAEERLAAYAVTRVLAGRTTTARPIVSEPAVVQLRRVEERRREPRMPARLAVCTSRPGEDDTLDGFTVDVSSAGLQLLMPAPPTDAHQDALVSDETGTSVLWVHVLDFRFLPEENAFSWHVSVLAADDDWMPLLRRLVLPD